MGDYLIVVLGKCYFLSGRSKDGVKGSPNISSQLCRPPAPPPTPEVQLTPEQLTPATPTVTVECKKDALSQDLKRFDCQP